METDKIKENLKKLENSPLFALSLGSKELFHSNFLYWLINAGVLGATEDGEEITGKELFTKVFNTICEENIIPSGNWVARREKMKFDLSLWTVKTHNKGKIIYTDKGLEEEDKCLLVIENKMKSVPSVKQLVEYIQKFKEDEVPKFILLTLMEDFPDREKIKRPTPEQLKKWKIKKLDCKIITYRDLIDQLKESIVGIKNLKPYYEALISDYIEFVDVLSNLNSKNSESENKSMMFGLDKEFNKLRILQLVQAIRVGVLYTLLREEFDKDKEQYKDIKFHTGYGRNGGAFLEILFAPGEGRNKDTGKELKDTNQTHYSIGVQVQGQHFAHFICPLKEEEKNTETSQKFDLLFAVTNFKFQQRMEEKGFKKANPRINQNLIFRSFGGFSFQSAEIPDQADYKFIVDQIIEDINSIIDKYKDKPDLLKIDKENKS